MRGAEHHAHGLGELRRDIAGRPRSAIPRPRASRRSRSSPAGRGCTRCSIHRVAHALHRAGVPVAPRALAYVSRALTGIEIHPAARVGDGLFIDHGIGVVIGETAEVGANVTLYQGVTLGGTGFETGKRHPTVQDNVTIGSGAKLLGPITIGHGAKIGANTVVIHDVPPNSTVVGNPGHPVRVEGRKPEGPDADWVHLPDPIADALKQMAAPDRLARARGGDAARGGPGPGRPRSCRCGPRVARAPPAGSLGRVPSFSHSVEVSRAARRGLPVAARGGQGPAVDVRPRALRRRGPAGRRHARHAEADPSRAGSTLDMEITAYDPPTRRGDVLRDQRREGRPARTCSSRPAPGTRLTQTLEAKASGLHREDADPDRPGAPGDQAHRGPRDAARGARRVSLRTSREPKCRAPARSRCGT